MTTLTEVDPQSFLFSFQEAADIMAVVQERGTTLEKLIHDAVMNDLYR